MLDVIFLIDGPYVSDYLKETIYRLNIPVIKTPEAQEHLHEPKTNYIDEISAQLKLSTSANLKVYTNSENALSWIYKNLKGSDLANRIFRVKDKVSFRQSLLKLHPDYFFKGIRDNELSSLPVDTIPFPVILKPSVGFFSLGVHKVTDEESWNDVISGLDETMANINNLYPRAVLDNTTFIIEEVIPGDEFAVDCYYDAQGKVVIFNMMQHLFASNSDVSDRVYITSGALMSKYLDPVKDYLNTLGAILQLHNFPSHIELRIDQDGSINVIEINPLRFGGWCSTPDMAYYAWGVNIYEQLITGSRPDWETLTEQQSSKVYALVVLDNSTGVKGDDIKSFDYTKLLKRVSRPLELRKTDFSRHPLFGFLMCEVPEDDLSELYDLLKSDLKEFIELK